MTEIDRELIIETRKAFNITQAEAAKLIYCKTLTWSQWETGRRSMHPAFFELFKLKANKELTKMKATEFNKLSVINRNIENNSSHTKIRKIEASESATHYAAWLFINGGHSGFVVMDKENNKAVSLFEELEELKEFIHCTATCKKFD